MNSDPDPLLKLDYEQVHNTFRLLTDIRFKLLALLPTVTGVAIALLTKDGAGASASVMLLIGLFGFGVTLGLIIYDLRNSQLYNAVLHRGKYLELRLRFPPHHELNTGEETGGMFRQRLPSHGSFLFLEIQHDRGLSVVYGTVLGGWMFLITKGLLVTIGPMFPHPTLAERIPWLHLTPGSGVGTTLAALAVAVASALFFIQLLINNDRPRAVNLTGYPSVPDPTWRAYFSDVSGWKLTKERVKRRSALRTAVVPGVYENDRYVIAHPERGVIAPNSSIG